MGPRFATIVALSLLLSSPRAAARRKPAPVSLFPTVEMKAGVTTIVIRAYSRSPRPIFVCRDERECLLLEVEGKGGAYRAWRRLPAKAAALDRGAFVKLVRGKGRVLFRLPVVPLAARGRRSFQVGAAHYLAALPSKVKYRFRYRASAPARSAARRLQRRPLFAGPAGPSSSPNFLRTYENSEVLDLVAKGDPSASSYLKPGDPKVLPRLRRLLRHKRFSVKESAIRALIATRLPPAAKLLVRVAEREKNQQLRAFAINGFLKLHPPSIKDDLIRLAASRVLARDEFAEMMQATLIKAVGMMDKPRYLVDLKKLERKLPRSKAPFEHSTRFAFLLARARLGDARAPKKLLTRLRKLPPAELASCLRVVPYCRSRALAAGLGALLTDGRRGSRIAPHADFVRPRTAAARKRIADFERRAYARIKDDALYAAAGLLPGAKWGFDPKPLRRYTSAELRRARALLKKLARALRSAR